MRRILERQMKDERRVLYNTRYTNRYSTARGYILAESEDFETAKNMYARKAEHLQQIIDQQRTRLDQIAAEQQRIKKEARF